MKNIIVIIILATSLIGFSQQSRNTRKNLKPNDFMVIGYLMGRNVDTTAIPFHRLTHINFSFAVKEKMAGVMIRKISHDLQDDRSLLKAINQAALKSNLT